MRGRFLSSPAARSDPGIKWRLFSPPLSPWSMAEQKLLENARECSSSDGRATSLSESIPHDTYGSPDRSFLSLAIPNCCSIYSCLRTSKDDNTENVGSGLERDPAKRSKTRTETRSWTHWTLASRHPSTAARASFFCRCFFRVANSPCF